MKSIFVATAMGFVVLGPAPALAAQGADLCALLTKAEVQQAFPDVKQGKLDRELERMGILRCHWDYAGGRMAVIESDEITDSPKDEAIGSMEGFLDPLRANARQLRYEVLPGVGDEAVAAVERKDAAKGVVVDAAVLVVRRGKRQITVMAPGLAQRERAQALQILGTWGKAIAKRLG